MTGKTIIVWFREDLRVDNNPALVNAAENAKHIIPVYIFDEGAVGDWPMGAASRWWLERSLKSLSEQLNSYQSDLLIFNGQSVSVLLQIISETKADGVYWNRLYSPMYIKRDMHIKKELRNAAVEAESFEGNVLIEPWKTLNKTNTPYKVFTPFWKRIKDDLISQPPVVPPVLEMLPSLPKRLKKTESLQSLKLYRSNVDWAGGFSEYWRPGFDGIKQIKKEFLGEEINEYSKNRDLPNIDGTSKLSPHLHFGEISVRQVWLEIYQAMPTRSQAQQEQMWSYLRQLAWRDFSQYLLFHFEQIDKQPFRAGFARFPWLKNQNSLHEWQAGKTGYPLVDAGMRQLWQTGWMHNRVRMVCASFLTKHLLIHWREGAKWFWDTLVDADLANNSCGWQWVAGSGADAAPYFRIFNPISQSKKFDPKGDYIRRWIPELRNLNAKFIHEPWLADETTLKAAGLELGKDYPHIIIEHVIARQRALEAFAQLRK